MGTSKTAAALSKAIKTLETANAKILQERNARDIVISHTMVLGDILDTLLKT